MDIGVRLFYIIQYSRERWDIDRQVHMNVVNNIYKELTKASPLFYFLSKSGMKASDIIIALT